MRTCRDCMNIFYPEDEFDCQDLCPTCRNDEVTIAMVDTKSPCSKTLNQQVKSLKDKIAEVDGERKLWELRVDEAAGVIETLELKLKRYDQAAKTPFIKGGKCGGTTHSACDCVIQRTAELEDNEQELLYLANVTLSFIDLKPEHPLYKSIREDIKGSLARLKTGEAKPHSEVEKLKAKLDKYGGHTQQCALNFHPLNTQCTCGWKKS